MSEFILTDELSVTLPLSMASDLQAVQAARVSVESWDEITASETDPAKLINSLVKLRHGVPFERTFFSFHVEIPIFVARQWVKHRLSSMNEKSARYGKMIPKFYQAGASRPMVNQGSKMHPKMVPGTGTQVQVHQNAVLEVSKAAFQAYEFQLKYGIAEELARIVLPLATYTEFVWTVNARSVMSFLERRIESEENRVQTHPQWEIDVAARMLEELFKEAMPLTHAAFVRNGRVAP